MTNHRLWFSYRGLSPHQFMPMLGVHKSLHMTLIPLRFIRANELSRYVFFSVMSNILKLLFVVAGTTFLAAEAKAKEEITHATSCATLVPRIEIGKAVQIANDAFSKIQSTESSFIDSVSLECKDKRQFWIIGFRRRAYETGHLLIYVYMDGTTETSMVKDG